MFKKSFTDISDGEDEEYSNSRVLSDFDKVSENGIPEFPDEVNSFNQLPNVAENLTQNQVKLLLDNIETEKQACIKQIAQLSLEREKLELGNSSPELQQKYMTLKEYETAIEILNRRSDQLSRLLVKPRTTQTMASDLPQVILCSPWQDEAMPKIVLCPEGRLSEKGKLHKAFETCFTRQQMEAIEKERGWVTVNTNQLEVQIASLKGELLALNQENAALGSILNESQRGEAAFVVTGPEVESSKHVKHKKKQKVIPCSKYAKKNEYPDMTIVLNSSMGYNTTDVGVGEDLEVECKALEKKIQDLQAQLQDLKARNGTLKSLKNALHCVSSAN